MCVCVRARMCVCVIFTLVTIDNQSYHVFIEQQTIPNDYITVEVHYGVKPKRHQVRHRHGDGGVRHE